MKLQFMPFLLNSKLQARSYTIELRLLKVPGTYSPSSSHPKFEAPESGFLNVFIEI